MAEDTPVVTGLTQFNAEVASEIATSMPSILRKLVELFSKDEIERRTRILSGGFSKHTEAVAAFSKLRPDHIIFQEDGETIKEKNWTAPAKSARDKAKKTVEKFANAINAAISKSDFKLLEDALRGDNQKDSQKDSQKPDDAA
jgi:hypothetical protein